MAGTSFRRPGTGPMGEGPGKGGKGKGKGGGGKKAAISPLVAVLAIVGLGAAGYIGFLGFGGGGGEETTLEPVEMPAAVATVIPGEARGTDSVFASEGATDSLTGSGTDSYGYGSYPGTDSYGSYESGGGTATDSYGSYESGGTSTDSYDTGGAPPADTGGAPPDDTGGQGLTGQSPP